MWHKRPICSRRFFRLVAQRFNRQQRGPRERTSSGVKAGNANSVPEAACDTPVPPLPIALAPAIAHVGTVTQDRRQDKQDEQTAIHDGQPPFIECVAAMPPAPKRTSAPHRLYKAICAARLPN